MSIWSSWEDIGYDFWVGKRPKKVRGQVRSYATGWSNHYPDPKVETPASLGVASIPTWCVPGVTKEDYDAAGPWLRLDIDAPSARTWWRKDENGQPEAEPQHASVVMDVEAVRALVDDLTKWLAMPKVHPKRTRRKPTAEEPK